MSAETRSRAAKRCCDYETKEFRWKLILEGMELNTDCAKIKIGRKCGF